MSSKILKAMENIDDECEEQGIIFVKVRILSGKHPSDYFHFTPGIRQEMRPRPKAWVWLSCRGWCTTRTTSPTSTPATSGLVLQKVPSEANPKVRNHGEGPY